MPMVDLAEQRSAKLAGFVAPEDMMFYAKAGGAPWHKLQTGDNAREVEEALTSAEAIKAAGLDWLVEFRTPFININGSQVKMPHTRAVVRMDTGTILGAVGDSYSIVQNVEHFEILDSLVATGDLRYETAGSLFEGRKVWIMARIPEEISIGGDKHYPFILASSGHDGRNLLRIQDTDVRAVCWNTVKMTMFSTDPEIQARSISIRHVGNPKEKIAKAREILGLTVTAFKRFGETCNVLQATDGLPIIESLIEQLFPVPANREKHTPKQVERMETFRTIVTAEADRMGSSKPTAYDLFNAVTGYTDHVQSVDAVRGGKYGGKEDSRMHSVLFGGGAEQLKAKGLEWILSLSDVREKVPVRVR